MICVVQTPGHGYCFATVVRCPDAPSIRLLTYDQIFRSRRFQRATYIFTDFDRLGAADVELAANLYLHLRDRGFKVLNNPARVKTRYTLLRALHRAGLNDYQVHAATELPDELRFPVYIRSIRSHGHPHTDLLADRPALESAVEQLAARGLPLENLMVIEYAGEPVRPGLYRKLSAFRMADKIIPHLCGHDRNWLVKRGVTGIAGEELYDDELRLVRENPHAATLRRAFEIAQIEYGRADFGFLRGRLQVFEINTLPHIPAPAPHPFPVRIETQAFCWEKIIEGLRGLDSPPGPAVVLPKTALIRPYRAWTALFHRTRPVA